MRNYSLREMARDYAKEDWISRSHRAGAGLKIARAGAAKNQSRAEQSSEWEQSRAAGAGAANQGRGSRSSSKPLQVVNDFHRLTTTTNVGV